MLRVLKIESKDSMLYTVFVESHLVDTRQIFFFFIMQRIPIVEEQLHHTLVLYLIFIALVIDCLKFIEDLFGCCQQLSAIVINLNCSLVTIVIILNVNI
jgi:hypothetical protein